jgi:hypothetical protein
MTTYSVYERDGVMLASRLSALEAAREILEHNGKGYEFGRGRDCWRLRIPIRGRMITVAYSYAEAKDAAWEDVAQQVISADWSGYPVALPDTDIP